MNILTRIILNHYTLFLTRFLNTKPSLILLSLSLSSSYSFISWAFCWVVNILWNVYLINLLISLLCCAIHICASYTLTLGSLICLYIKDAY